MYPFAGKGAAAESGAFGVFNYLELWLYFFGNGLFIRGKLINVIIQYKN